MYIPALLLACLTGTWVAEQAADPPTDRRSEAEQREALERAQFVVGEWRGVGQPRRGSSRGAWTEEGAWAWEFPEGNPPALVWTCPDGKSIQLLRLISTGAESYRLAVEEGGASRHVYDGGPDEEGAWVFTAEEGPDGLPHRLLMRSVADGDRLVIRYERRAGDRYVRLAEVGYTRRGSRFGQGGAGVVCVVTGGEGTIPVMHQGRTYYVCCSGCRDYFEEDPERALEEYRRRREAERDDG